MVYLILKNGEHQFYGNLKLLCKENDLGYSKFVKHFANLWHYKDSKVEIFKGELKRGIRST